MYLKIFKTLTNSALFFEYFLLKIVNPALNKSNIKMNQIKLVNHNFKPYFGNNNIYFSNEFITKTAN